MQLVSNIEPLGINSSSRVLLLMPHPDDEAVFVSGLLQKIALQNLPIKCITFTAGENSTLRFGLNQGQNLADARKQELAQAYTILGIRDFDILNFPDGDLERHQPEITRHFQKIIKIFSPTHLVTLEPDGIYGHPDHVALSQYVSDCLTSPTKLIYVTVSPSYLMPSARSMAKKSHIKPIIPQYKLTLTPNQAITKLRALYCHQSQFNRFPNNLISLIHFLLNDMLFHEYYTYKDAMSTTG